MIGNWYAALIRDRLTDRASSHHSSEIHAPSILFTCSEACRAMDRAQSLMEPAEIANAAAWMYRFANFAVSGGPFHLVKAISIKAVLIQTLASAKPVSKQSTF